MQNHKKLKILIIGGDGMAGHMIKSYFTEKKYDVYATTRREIGENQFFLDVLDDTDELEKILANIKPDFIINCIGILNQSATDDKKNAVFINSYLPHYIDNLSEDYNFKFVHISTDCVFSGKKGQYAENDFTDAESFYGRSKSLGEVINNRSVTFRTSIIGPDVNSHGIGLFNWFMKESGEIQGFEKVVWSGITTLELAKAIEKSFNTDVTGLYHLVNNESINKYDLLLLFKKYMKKDISIIKEVDYVSDKSLVNNRADYDFDIPGYGEMIEEMSVWINNHKIQYETLFVNK